MTMPMHVKADRAAASGVERRAYPVALQVVRSQAGPAADAAVVEGYASVTEAPFEMWDGLGPYQEVMHRGAFGKTLAESPAVQLLLNHGGLSMAYTRAGTLQLSEDSKGLHMRAEVNPVRSDIADMLTALEDGAVDEMSFAFRVTRQTWSPEYDQRDIHEVDIHRGDVSVVNFGANPETSAALVRSLDFQRLGDVERRALIDTLSQSLAAPARPTVPSASPTPACCACCDAGCADGACCDTAGDCTGSCCVDTGANSFTSDGMPLTLARTLTWRAHLL